MLHREELENTYDPELAIHTRFTRDDWLSGSDNEREAAANNRSSTCCCVVLSPCYIVAIFAPLAAALTEAAYMAISVYESNEVSIYALAFTSSVTFLSSFQYNNGFRSSNIATLCEIAHSRQLPNDWPSLPKIKEAAAFSTALLPTGWAILSEYSQTYFSLGETFTDYKLARHFSPLLWKISKLFISFCAGYNALLSTGFETWRMFRYYLAGKNDNTNAAPAENNIKPCYIIRVPLTALNLLNAVQDGIYVFVAIETNFGTDDLIQRSALGAFCLLTVIGNLCTEGPFVIHFAEEGYHYAKQRKCEPSKLIASAITIGTATTLAYYTRFLVEEFYNKVAKDYDFDDLPYVTQIFFYLSCILTAQHILSNTASMYDLTYRIVNGFTNTLRRTYHGICEYLFPIQQGNNDEKESFLANDNDDDNALSSDDDVFKDRRAFYESEDDDDFEETELDILKTDPMIPENLMVPGSMHESYRSSSNRNLLFSNKEKREHPRNEAKFATHRSCVLF